MDHVEVCRLELSNGMQVLVMPMEHTYAVSLAFFVRAGARYEEDRLAGVTHFIEHMVFKGSAKWPTAREIAETIEGVGGLFNASTGRESTVYYAKVAALHFDLALDVLVDMLRHPLFAPEEIERERRVIVEEINQSLDMPDELVLLLVDRVTWDGHPLGRDVAGTPESVRQLQREDLLAYMARHYGPRNVVVSVAGHVDPDEVCARLEGVEWWPDGEVATFAPAPPLDKRAKVAVVRRETEQAHLCFHLPGLPRNHPDRWTMQLLNGVLGEGMGARLFQRVREQMGLAYSVSSYLVTYADAGLMQIYAGVDVGRVEEAIRAILDELRRMVEEQVTEAELRRAREYLKGRFLLQMEDSFALATWYGQQVLLTPKKVLTPDDVVAEVDRVTPDAIQDLARRLFGEGGMVNLAVVGPYEDEGRFRRVLEEEGWRAEVAL